jgi:predicted AlkP superfamily phosphohydrolase/phosphomutase
MLQRPPIWELLSDAGVRSGVVRFDFTFPAAGQSEYVISSRAGRDSWDWARVEKWTGEGLASPEGIAKELLAPFGEEIPQDEALLARFLPGPPRPRSRRVAFEIQMLRIALDIDRRTTEAALQILERSPDLRFFGVYLGGFDNICHAFWPYRFPEEYGKKRPAPEDVAEFKDIIDRYLEFIDECLGRLIAAYPEPPNVLIAADHGHVATEEHPLWLGWHGESGIFIASGPTFPRRRESLQISYYDIVPTIADALGFELPPGMHGSSVLAQPGSSSVTPPR